MIVLVMKFLIFYTGADFRASQLQDAKWKTTLYSYENME